MGFVGSNVRALLAAFEAKSIRETVFSATGIFRRGQGNGDLLTAVALCTPHRAHYCNRAEHEKRVDH